MGKPTIDLFNDVKQGSVAEALESVGSGYLPTHQVDMGEMRAD